jgi:hypothetical protein
MKTREPLTFVEIQELRRIRIVFVIIAVTIVATAAYFYWSFHPNRPVDYDEITEHFKYGSIGSEPANGLPYWIFKVMPDMFPEKLSGKGYASLGLIEEPGHDLPVGFSKRRVIIDRVGLNCGVCHTGTIRETPNSQPTVIVGMPANRLELESYIRFLTAAALDPRFTTDNVMTFIEARTKLGPIEKFIYRTSIPLTREALIEQGARLGFIDKRPDWGPGRVDTFNPYKAIQFHWPMDHDNSVGTSDYPAIWNQRPREGMQLHWDGNNSSVEERNKSAALGAGVTPATIDLDRLKRIEDWLLDFKAPAYPYAVNADLASKGEAIYRQHCSSCHDFGSALIGKVTPIQEIGTDPSRLDSYTYTLASNQNTLYAGYPWRFSHFRKTNGYANMPLDGIWLRAPYLHNGSVPTLRDLLEPPDKRPKEFYRGYNVFDQKNVGFISNVASEGSTQFFRFDTSLPGNSNSGHVYGTNLSAEEKDAIVEYMKRL